MTTINAVGNGLTGATGTGNFVGATSPTLITPNIGAATATSIQTASGAFILGTSGTKVLEFLSQSGSQVNYTYISGSNTGVLPVIGVAGTDTNVSMQLAAQGTGGIFIKGTGTSDNASAGYVGEFVTATLGIGSAVSLTTNVVANVTTLSLTAGDWDVWGEVWYGGGSTTNYTLCTAAINVTSATLTAAPNATYPQVQQTPSGNIGASGAPVVPTSISRISVASTTTVYLLAFAVFTVSTLAAYGVIRARRVR